MAEYKIVRAYRNTFTPWEEPGGKAFYTGFDVEFPDKKIFRVWKYKIIQKMEQQPPRKFYMEENGQKFYLQIFTQGGEKYLKTSGDTNETQHLSYLPQDVFNGPWDTPTINIKLQFEARYHLHIHRWNTQFPQTLDSAGELLCLYNFPIGYCRSKTSKGLFGSYGYNILARLYLKPDLSNIGNGEIIDAVIKLKKHETICWQNSSASNVGSPLNSVWRMLVPFDEKEYVAPNIVATPIISGIPTYGGQLIKPGGIGAGENLIAAEYNTKNETITLNLDRIFDLWRTGAFPNHGLIFLGTNESHVIKNNNTFYACYSIDDVSIEQAYDW